MDAHGFRFDGDAYQEFDFPDATATHLAGINESDALAGYFATDTLNNGFILNERRLVQISATSFTQATGVNDEGQVVGFFLNGRSLQEAWHQSFLFDSEAQEFTDVNIPLPGPDCTFSLAEPITHCVRLVTGINSDGTITGYFDDDDGVFRGFIGTIGGPPLLQAGDADRNLKFDQQDLVQVLTAGKYLTGLAATWGQGDWDNAPNGSPDNPPLGDGVFDENDIIAAAAGDQYLGGFYAARDPKGQTVREKSVTVGYDSRTGEMFLTGGGDRTALTSVKIESAAGVFRGEAPQHLHGAFDHADQNRLFKATFGGSFDSLSFGRVALAGLTEEFLRSDVSVEGSLAGGGRFGDVNVHYVPEPSVLLLLATAIPTMLFRVARTAVVRTA